MEKTSTSQLRKRQRSSDGGIDGPEEPSVDADADISEAIPRRSHEDASIVVGTAVADDAELNASDQPQENEQHQQQQPLTSSRIFISNLDPTVTEFRIKKAFEPFGNISKLDFVWNKATGLPRGFCFLSYEDVDSARRAMEAMNGRRLYAGSRKMVVSVPKPRTTDAEDGTPRAATPAGNAADKGRDRNFRYPSSGFGGRGGARGGHTEQVNLRLQPKKSTASIDTKISALESKIKELEKPLTNAHSIPPRPRLAPSAASNSGKSSSRKQSHNESYKKRKIW